MFDVVTEDEVSLPQEEPGDISKEVISSEQDIGSEDAISPEQDISSEDVISPVQDMSPEDDGNYFEEKDGPEEN